MNLIRALVLMVLAVALPVGVAHATLLTGNFNISVYQGSGNGNINDANNQANAANPLLSTTALYSGTYTGDINFDDGGSNNILNFLLSGGGALSGSTTALNTTMSLGNFATTTLLDLTWFDSSTLGGTVLHDDGASLYVNGGLVMGAPYPVTPTLTPFQAANGGNYRIIYAAANGLPEVLKVDITSSVPEPATLAQMGLGLIGLGLTKRSSKSL